jgi:hypothetical protein
MRFPKGSTILASCAALLKCNTLHPLPRRHEDARVAKLKSIDQEHLIE